MRYNHESYLPIGAFQPILGRMTLHGGGGNPLDVVSDIIGTGGGDTGLLNIIDEGVQAGSDVFAAADDAIFQPITAPISQLTSALDEAIVQPITAPISEVGVAIDDAVADVIPGGWGTLAQVAAAATGNPYIIGATSAGVNFARNKDLKSAIEAGAISGGTAGITQGLGDAFQLGDIGRAGISAGLSGGVDYARTGDINSALKAGAKGGAMSYAGSQLGEYAAPYLNELKGDFGKYLQEQGVNLSNLASPSNLDPDLGMPGEVSGPSNFYPDAAPALPGELQMTDSGEFINKNPDIQNTDFIPKKIELTPDLRIKEDILNQANLDAAYTPDSQYINQDAQGYDKVKFKDDPYRYLASRGVEGKDYVINKATGAIDYLSNTNPLDYPGDLYDAAKDYYNESSPGKLALTAAGLYGLSNLGGGSSEQGKSQAQIEAEAEANKTYSYGTSNPLDAYLLKNRINAGNVYSNATGYRPLTRYADGGEVQHFAGGGIKDFVTRYTQPIEKAILRPIGEAAPFLKDMAPYAGVAAGAMMGNPAMAAGIGGLASGFGKPGGFDMKRALMGGIAAYGMSNLAGGIEAAGTEPAFMGSIEDPLSSGIPLQPANQTFRNPEAMQKGIGNLLQNTNTPAYKDAMTAFTKNAGIYNAGVPLIMGTTGMMGVDESNALKQESDKATAINQADEAEFNARVAAGKKRAQQAVSQNPYMFAMGGVINPPDDQTGMPNQTPMQKFELGGAYSYADGGPVTNQEDIDYMIQIENNRREVDPMSDERYAGLLKQNQDYLSNIYGNIYNKPASEQPDIETVRANAQKALDMSQNVQTNIADATAAVNTAQDLIGMPTVTAPPPPPPPPPPVVTTPDPIITPPPPVITEPIAPPPPPPPTPSPRATTPTATNPTSQYLVSNPTDSSPLSSSNIYQYQKKKRGYAEGGDVQGYFFGGSIMEQLRPQIEEYLAKQDAEKAAEAAKMAAKNEPSPVVAAPPSSVSNEPTLPPPTFSPRATPSGQYLVSNPYDLEPLSSSNIYDYQKKRRGYAEGGLPRFLSGGGDGMSDSIRANIEGSQEARLADGEFVIPADVVSHLGNGSSKAGAKQLYAMMDRVRKARTGNPKQGRQIKPTKFMPV